MFLLINYDAFKWYNQLLIATLTSKCQKVEMTATFVNSVDFFFAGYHRFMYVWPVAPDWIRAYFYGWKNQTLLSIGIHIFQLADDFFIKMNFFFSKQHHFNVLHFFFIFHSIGIYWTDRFCIGSSKTTKSAFTCRICLISSHSKHL